MERPIQTVFLVCALLFVLNGCANYMAQKVVPTPIIQAQQEIPEEELLDVGIAVFESEELTEEKAKKEGTHPDIRKAERHFIPYHLKNTLQQSSHWGAVRVIPTEIPEVDLLVKGEIIESNGEHLIVKIDVIDAAGSTWLHKAYKAEATDSFYSGNVSGQKDAFQDLYNSIANDMAAFKKKLGRDEIQKIRTISKLKFASDFAPDAFEGYLSKDKKDRINVNRLPADDDPMMDRLLQIRDRDHMYVDVLNEYFEGFYNDMWHPYEDWRKTNLVEQVALRKMKRDAYVRQAAGALMMALALGLAIGDVDNTYALQNILIFGGGMVMVDGFNISKQAEIHRMAIQELSESFGSEMKPVVMEFKGKEYELTGSAEEQYKHWRELLRKIYYEETGFEQPDDLKTNRDTLTRINHY